MSTDTNAKHAGDDIKHMLSEVIAHITDADRRSTASLRQMQERLESLGHEARAVRHGVPADYLPGFDRIEDGMSLLASRIAQSYAARQQTAATFAEPLPSFAAFTASQPAPHAAAVDHPATIVSEAYVPTIPAAHVDSPLAIPTARHDQTPPNPLSSSSPGLLRARPKSYASNVDTFDVIETMPDTPSDTWSADTAEALVDVYANDETLPFQAAALAPTSTTPTDEPVASLQAVDKNWLDARLSDIATRVERSFAESRSDKALASMEHRLNEFEHRMVAALNGVASKGDVESLANLETQIRELRAQFELTHSELMRIDDLERQLSLIAHQTSEDNFGAMMNRFVPETPAHAQPSSVDFHSVAIAAAEAAASRVSNASAARGSRVEDVHALLADFIQERRQGEEQTANTLDTLQQAMLRILDRVDAIELSPLPTAYPGDHIEPQRAPAYIEPELPRAAPLAAAPAAVLLAEPIEEVPVPAGDYLAQQRAKMQASVQRAAAAQREKQRAQAEAGDGKPTGPRPPKPAGNAGSRRLMVSSMALAVIAGGIGAFAVMSAPRDGSTPLALNATGQSSTTGGQLSKPQLATNANTTTVNSEASARNAPQTVTGDLDEVTVNERKSVPDSQFARAQTSTPAPMSGILLQGSDDLDAPPAPANAAPNQPTTRATQVAAQPTDLEQMTQSQAGTSTQSRGALDLPPATVGPLSLRLAAAQGDMSAEFEVASRLAEGKGTDQNLKEAVRWYQRSATQGFAQAQYRLGTFFERGLGMKADAARARSWYQRAADQGNVKAMHNLAVLAAGRSAESPDYTTAARWFTQAAGYGLPDSQFNLAVLTESGLGVEKDMVQAAMWFTIAARSGDKEAMRRRDLMKTKMDAKDLAAADHLVKSWQPMMPEKMANDPRAAGEAWKSRQAATPQPN